MRIGFDARAAFLDPHRGFGRFTRSLAEALLQAAPGEVVVFVPHGVLIPPPWYLRAASVVQLTRPRRGAFLVDAPAWAFTLRRHRVDVLHLPTWGVPRGLRVPVVATFYDATPFRFPSPARRWTRHRARRAIASLARATRVHAISRHAGNELLGVAAVSETRVSVVPLGVDAAFTPGPAPVPPRHALFVGGGDPHKNLDLALAVWAHPAAAALPPLVVAGAAAADPRLQPLLATGTARAIPHPGDGELVELYRGALALLVPSRNEGFGLPALEAMACGCPVVAARAGALPEVCGAAAVLLDPDDPGAWRDAVTALASDPARRTELAAAGLERARAFTWERTARGMLELYRLATRRES
ncbi:MAG: glycosyltransferase family 1 protein [Thermoanaerobaculaceae bacterium]|nr:glycosyltransferase family 1 protein [Thermoanaerobaculaceae bacterium]